MTARTLILVFLSAAACGHLSASDWPVYKGNIYYTGNNDELIVKTNLLKWQFRAAGQVYNPIVSDGRVYLADIGKTVYCLSEETGELIWSVSLTEISRRFGSASAVAGKIKYPVLSGPYLFLSDATALYCLDKVTGRVVWARAGVQESDKVSFVTDSIYADPILSEGRVYYGTRKNFLSRDLNNGHIRWTNNSITSWGGFPSVFSGYVFTQSKDLKKNRFTVICLDAATGHVVWQTDIENSFTVYNPVIYQGRVYIASGKKLFCLDLATGRSLWSREYSDIITSGPSFTDRQILFSVGNRTVVVINPLDGAVDYDFPTGELSSPSFVTVRDQLYMARIAPRRAPDGSMVNYTELTAWRFADNRVPIWNFSAPYPGGPSQPAASGGILFLPAGDYLYAVGDKGPVQSGPGWPDIPDGPVIILTNTVTLTNTRTNVLTLTNFRTNALELTNRITNITETNFLPPTFEDKKKGESLVVENITFEYNEAYLRKESLPVLDAIVAGMKKNPRLVLEVRGHTDSTGDEKGNQVLSEKRAEAVTEYLIKQGISPHRLRSKGYGESQPVAGNDTEEGRARNRRTEFFIIDR